VTNNTLNHINQRGEAHMVDVGAKPHSERRAWACAYVTASPQTLQLIERGQLVKGDVLAVARVAGIQAAKKCADLIPLCHPLLITHVDVEISIQHDQQRIKIQACVALNGQTGVEMEAMTAASVAALTLYDMCKAVDKGMVIREIFLARKTGGKSGDWHSPLAEPDA
jgi:cyclic pyranopterin monophosphate synthase